MRVPSSVIMRARESECCECDCATAAHQLARLPPQRLCARRSFVRFARVLCAPVRAVPPAWTASASRVRRCTCRTSTRRRRSQARAGAREQLLCRAVLVRLTGLHRARRAEARAPPLLLFLWPRARRGVPEDVEAAWTGVGRLRRRAGRHKRVASAAGLAVLRPAHGAGSRRRLGGQHMREQQRCLRRRA